MTLKERPPSKQRKKNKIKNLGLVLKDRKAQEEKYFLAFKANFISCEGIKSMSRSGNWKFLGYFTSHWTTV